MCTSDKLQIYDTFLQVLSILIQCLYLDPVTAHMLFVSKLHLFQFVQHLCRILRGFYLTKCFHDDSVLIDQRFFSPFFFSQL